MERDNMRVEMTVSSAEPVDMEEQELNSLTKEGLQEAIRNYNAQSQVCFRN
jgi:hypothetical protein